MAKDWEDRTDQTLKRIESQADDSPVQEGFAKSFRELVLVSLTRIEASLKKADEFMAESRADREQIRTCLAKIPEIEKGLNNHLKSHDTFKRYVVYPLSVMMLAGFGALIWQTVVHILR